MGAHRIYEDLELPPSGRRASRRPYVLINMVSSLDGRTTVEGKAARIGSETDRRVMRTLRSKADAVMIGAGTLRAERLSLGLDDSVGPQPLAVVVTASGNVPIESNLISDERQEVLVITPEDVRSVRLPERARYEELQVSEDRSGTVDLAEALKMLKTEHAVDLLLVEGGPSLNHALVSANVVDEIFLTLAPKLLGGTTPEALGILAGHQLSAVSPRLRLLSIHLAGDELYLRYAVTA
jgi:2,5-diamino-6-(ribosylamino)-4(3H)-pyrimidinone 5'-phosphate reductase